MDRSQTQLGDELPLLYWEIMKLGALDAATIVGFLLQLTKLSEFILLQSQQERLKEWMASGVLRLSYTRPLDWFRDFEFSDLRKLILGSSIFTAVAALLAYFLFIEMFPQYQFGNVQKILFVIACIMHPVLARKAGKVALEWLLRDRHTAPFLLRYFLLILCGTAVIVAFYLICSKIDAHLGAC